MRKEVVVRVPARQASTTTKVKVLCDICGKPVIRENYGHGGGECSLCHRDVCAAHRDYDPHEDGDYPDKYCTICYRLKFGTYWAEHEKLETEYDKAEESLEAKIKKESLEATI